MKKTLILLSIFFIALIGLKISANIIYPLGSLLKLPTSSTVYYVGEDNKKYVFPDGKTYDTYYDNFDNIIEVSVSALDQYPDGGAMPYKAGTKLITHQNTNKIYAIEPNGILRWIPTEETAIKLYGVNWFEKVQDIIPGYFSTSYTQGLELSNKLPTGTIVRQKNTNNYYYIENGNRKEFSNYQDYKIEDIVELDDLDDYNGVNDVLGLDSINNDVDDDGYDSVISGANDCNDSSAAIYPGAMEICGDGIDQDCSGADLECQIPNNIIINSLSDNISSDGQTITILGRGFGNKGQGAVLMFDEISNVDAYNAYGHGNGDIVPTRGDLAGPGEDNPYQDCSDCPWYNHTYGRTPVFYIGENSRYGDHPAYKVSSLGGSSQKGFLARDFNVNTDEGWTYLDWWYRSSHDVGVGAGGGVSGKSLRLWPNSHTVDQLVVAKNGDTPGSQLVTGMVSCGLPQDTIYFSAPIGEWVHLGVATHISSQETVSYMIVNGRNVGSVNNLCSDQGVFDYIRMIGYDPSVAENVDPDMEYLWGDIYFDDGQARVIVADAVNYNSHGNDSEVHYEMQNIVSWSDSLISLEVNKGSFSSEQQLYLFVIDDFGNVSMPQAFSF